MRTPTVTTHPHVDITPPTLTSLSESLKKSESSIFLNFYRGPSKKKMLESRSEDALLLLVKLVKFDF